MIDFQNANEIFDVYGRYPSSSGGTQGYMLGRFLVEDGKIKILEDHQGILGSHLSNGPVNHSLVGLRTLTNSAYMRVVAESEVTKGKEISLGDPETNPTGPQPQSPPANVEDAQQGEAPETLIPEEHGFAMQSPPPVFDYFRVGMLAPQVLEVKGDQVYMNGQLLPQGEVQHILQSIHNGLAKIKYRKAI